jgi:hypothetical protein
MVKKITGEQTQDEEINTKKCMDENRERTDTNLRGTCIRGQEKMEKASS